MEIASRCLSPVEDDHVSMGLKDAPSASTSLTAPYYLPLEDYDLTPSQLEKLKSSHPTPPSPAISSRLLDPTAEAPNASSLNPSNSSLKLATDTTTSNTEPSSTATYNTSSTHYPVRIHRRLRVPPPQPPLQQQLVTAIRPNRVFAELPPTREELNAWDRYTWEEFEAGATYREIFEQLVKAGFRGSGQAVLRPRMHAIRLKYGELDGSVSISVFPSFLF